MTTALNQPNPAARSVAFDNYLHLLNLVNLLATRLAVMHQKQLTVSSGFETEVNLKTAVNIAAEAHRKAVFRFEPVLGVPELAPAWDGVVFELSSDLIQGAAFVINDGCGDNSLDKIYFPFARDGQAEDWITSLAPKVADVMDFRVRLQLLREQEVPEQAAPTEEATPAA